MTSPPKDFTEATLLRAMETAGKQVEDDEVKGKLNGGGAAVTVKGNGRINLAFK